MMSLHPHAGSARLRTAGFTLRSDCLRRILKSDDRFDHDSTLRQRRRHSPN
jgi:hypothetical protein